MEHTPPIRSFMTPFAIAVEIDRPVREAEDLMIDHEVRHLAVTDRGELVGALSDRDVAFVSNGSDDDLCDKITVRDVCSLDVYAVSQDETLDHVLDQMSERHIGSAFVTDGEKIVGIFTSSDACRCFADFLRASS